MRYNAFKNIEIQDCRGVSPVAGDTTLLAYEAGQLKPKKVLEIGTGTGFVPIYLSKLGITCDGTDISDAAIACAYDNAKRNKVIVSFLVSDLFRNVTGKYDLILFNPPFGNTSGASVKYLELLKSFIPKKNDFAIWLSYFMIAKQRRKLIVEFLHEAKKHITKNGSVLLFLYTREMDIASSYRYIVRGTYKNFSLVQIYL